ncbi:MAG: hypothetical protein H7832_11235, partial [Magnetococcus sp. DMHC-6]
SSNKGYLKLNTPDAVSADNGTSTSSVPISWDPVQGATIYTIYRGSSSSSSSAIYLAESNTTSFNDSTADPGTAYYYFVKACFKASSTTTSCSSYSDSKFTGGN